MTTYVALLRAVNITGHRLVAMAHLRALLSQLGFADPRSLLQSGNLMFQAGARSSAHLERLLETETEKRLGLETEFFIRSGAEWKALVAHNPFREAARRDPAHLAVQFLKDAPPARSVAALRSAITGHEIVRTRGKELYAVYPDGFGRSRLTNALIERRLGTRATGRNWNTVLRLAAAVEG
jgi:uncharacterized protein (DUF1697 family)